MKRVLLDTNIYGLVVVDDERDKIHEYIHKKKEHIVIYGFYIVRKEIRDVPKKIKQRGKKLRIDLLNTYDEFVRKDCPLDKETEQLAEDYLVLYRRLGGSLSRDSMINDLLIVACASLRGLDIVVSEDRRSLLSETAVNAYEIVNKIKKIESPTFINYEAFKNELKK